MGTVIAFPLRRVVRRTEVALSGRSADIQILPVIRIERQEEGERPAAGGGHESGATGRRAR